MLHRIFSVVYVTCSPVPLVAVWVSPSELPANGTRDDQWAAPPFSQHAGSDVYARGPAMVPFLNRYGGPQASSSNAVQNQPHPSLDNVFVPESLGHARVDWPAPPHGSGAEQQQLTPHGYTERIDSRDDYADTVPMSSGSSDEMSDNEWTGTLNLNGKRIRARALMAGAIGDPYVHAFVKCVLVENSNALQKIIGIAKRFGSRTCRWSHWQFNHSRHPGMDTRDRGPDCSVKLCGWE